MGKRRTKYSHGNRDRCGLSHHSCAVRGVSLHGGAPHGRIPHGGARHDPAPGGCFRGGANRVHGCGGRGWCRLPEKRPRMLPEPPVESIYSSTRVHCREIYRIHF